MANQRAGQGKQKAYRLRFNFWLDIMKPEEELIADKIEGLKDERGFTAAIRDGIRLICDLKDGKLDVLFELFPWVRAEFLEYMLEVAQVPAEPDSRDRHGEPAPQPSSPQIEAERAWLEAEQERIEQERAWEQRRMEEAQKALAAEKQAIEQERQRMEAERKENQSAMQKQLDRLEQLLLQQGNVPVQSASPSRKASDVGLQGLSNGNVGLKGSGVGLNGAGLKGNGIGSTMSAPPPVFDDDDLPDLNISKAKPSGNANLNLINAMKSLVERSN